ncbi:MAG TPA: ABC transporter permease [Candidatus Eisenbacteria bacterium]|nr:ABC transporter permease [Candidatus Eisenbacteria bacterium]
MRWQIIKNSFATMLRKETVRIFRIWSQTLLPPLITQSLYFLIFGAFIGSRVGIVDGVPYMAFVVPGLVLMAVVQNSFSNVVFSFFMAKFQKSIEELLVSPMPDWVMLAGYVTGGVVRGVTTGLLVYLVSAVFAHPPMLHPWAVLVFLFLTSLLFSLAGFLNAVFAKKFDDVTVFSTFVLIPLTYLGGVFYSIGQLPPLWQKVSRLNPILYMVDGFRYGFFGKAGIPLYQSILLLTTMIAALIVTNLYLLRKGTGMKN